MRRLSWLPTLPLLCVSWSQVVYAHEDQEPEPDPEAVPPAAEIYTIEEEPDGLDVVVLGDARGGDAASRVRLGRRELDLRPRLRPGDIVEAVPGVFAVQHSGGGKANQFFVRGFDADHGTDVLITIDGIPANMVSHGHGQGYADLHFLIPELVVGLDGYKGAAYAHLGDFATGGAVAMRLAETLDESFAQLSIGQYGIYRGLVVASPKLGDSWRSVVAAEVYADDGPFVNEEDLLRFNLYGKVAHDLGANTTATLSLMSYGSKWNGSGQIPARAVCGEGEPGAAPPSDFGAGCIDRFGSVDPSEGGATQRHAARLAVDARFGDTELSTMLYGVAQNFTLYSNFTFFAEDPALGDGIEQSDERFMLGGEARLSRHFHLGSSLFRTSFGVQFRHDDIDNALYQQRERERIDSRVLAAISETSVGAFVEADARLTGWLRWVLGLRFDRIDADVEDRMEDLGGLGSKTSGVAGDMTLSPKASVVVSPVTPWDLFLSYGRGFHSNDARGAIRLTDPVDLITVAKTYEVGTRVRPVRGLSIDVASFLIDLDSEIVWVGDAGTTEASGATRRYGVEAGVRYRFADWFFTDAEFAFSEGHYVGTDDVIALAPRLAFSTGVGLRPTLDDFIPFFGSRLKALADRPANEDASLTALGFVTVDVNAGLRWKDLEVGVDIQNLFDTDWREVSFATDTRLAYEPSAVSGIHYSPGWPFTAIGRVAYYVD